MNQHRKGKGRGRDRRKEGKMLFSFILARMGLGGGVSGEEEKRGAERLSSSATLKGKGAELKQLELVMGKNRGKGRRGRVLCSFFMKRVRGKGAGYCGFSSDGVIKGTRKGGGERIVLYRRGGDHQQQHFLIGNL